MSHAAMTDRDILPEIVKPINYALSLYDLELGGAFSFKGTVSITAKILELTKSITLNAHQIKLHSAEVRTEHSKTQLSQSATGISYNAPKQRVILEFPEELPVSDALIVIKFEGTMNNDMAGFYRSKYKPAVTPAASVPKVDEYHYMFSTQFESSDARRAFPCFDEPNLKATFDLEIELPEDQVALSNMPEKEVKKGQSGLQVVSFDRTPIMSTYLLAWAVGDFEYVEDFTKRKYGGKHLPVRVYTTKGLKEQARFALEHAPKIIDYFSEIFDIDYPLPKSDLLAVHEFSHGAMENWGLVTYRTTAVLFDENVSDPKYKNRVAYVVAHELAHQWFGNLVTMDWWSELWLNEGFATWVGWLATDFLHPDWNVWPQFVTEGMQTAFGLDALRSSHPIEVPVKDALDVDQIFDHISYLKGCSVIGMLAAHLGQETFLKGVSNYLKAHAYGNATTNDLWSALSAASGQDVNALMDPWIKKIGYPVVTVAESSGQISVKQSRYLSTGDVTPDEDETTWWVPLGLKSKIQANKGAPLALTKKTDTIKDVDQTFYKLNTDNTGFYRTCYPPTRLVEFGKHINQLSMSDKIGIIGDTGALAFSGETNTPALLGFLEGFSTEESYLVWSQIADSLGTIKGIFAEDKMTADALKKFTLKLMSPAVAKIGWKFQPSEDYLTGQLRSLLIHQAGINGDRDVVTEAQRQFTVYTAGDSTSIHPSLRSAVFQINCRTGGAEAYNALKSEYLATTSVDGKETTLRALGRFTDQSLLPDFLDFLFTSVPTQDMHSGAIALTTNPESRLALWKYIQENFDAVKGKLGGNMVVLDRFLKVSLNKFSNLTVEKEIEAFFAGKDNRGYDRTLGVVSDTIKGRAGYRARDGKVLGQWLAEKGYA